MIEETSEQTGIKYGSEASVQAEKDRIRDLEARERRLGAGKTHHFTIDSKGRAEVSDVQPNPVEPLTVRSKAEEAQFQAFLAEQRFVADKEKARTASSAIEREKARIAAVRERKHHDELAQARAKREHQQAETRSPAKPLAKPLIPHNVGRALLNWQYKVQERLGSLTSRFRRPDKPTSIPQATPAGGGAMPEEV